MIIRKLLKDTKGAAVIEMAFALPVVATMMVGVLQAGQVMQANGALRHAVGEGIRYAKVNPDATETEVLNKTKAGLAGINQAGIKTLTFSRGTSNGAEYGRITMMYELEPVVPFAAVPKIQLSQTKQAYLPL
jgi:Flp pilus assembly protein TadG